MHLRDLQYPHCDSVLTIGQHIKQIHERQTSVKRKNKNGDGNTIFRLYKRLQIWSIWTFFGLLMLLFFCEILKSSAHRMLLVLASTLFFAFLGFAEVANTAFKAMG